MADPTITFSFPQWRYDSSGNPFAETGFDSTNAFVKLNDWLYTPATQGGMTFLSIANKSQKVCNLAIRPVDNFTWVSDANVTVVNDSGTGATITMTGAGPLGTYVDTELSTDLCSLQARILNMTGPPVGISLQDVAVPTHDYNSILIPHAIRLNQEGQGQILEFGLPVGTNGYFKYSILDSVMIELTSGVVRYYLITPGGEMTLLRTTRSKLTGAPKAEVMVNEGFGSFTDVWILNAPEVSITFESIGVLQNFQDWNNEYFISSTAETIMMANNEPQFTFPNTKTRLRSLNANLAMRDKTFRLEYEAFFHWHGVEKEFLFIDNAKTDILDNPVEWWARFASPFGDRSRNSCLSAHSAQILESYRNDYIPKSTGYGIP